MKTTIEEQRAFATVVDCASITGAAEQLGMTVSGVSRALNRLERKLGATLLRRTTRRLELTQEGETFLEHCRRILRAVDVAEESVRDRHGQPRGQLRINAAPSFMQFVIVPLIGEFRARYPGIHLQLDTHDRFVDLLEQRVDLAIRIGELDDSSLHARLLGKSPLRLLANPGYLARTGTPETVEDLAHHSLLGFSQLDHLNRWPLRGVDGEDVHIVPTLLASSGSTLMELAIQGEGIVCLADFMTQTPRRTQALVEVLPQHGVPMAQAVHAVYYRQATLSQRARLFIDFLVERLAGQYLQE